jgi:myo-inositol catabolism protein IolC
VGYSRPLYVLPFDHRHSYVSGLFHVTSPAALTPDQRAAVVDSKRVIYEGFQEAIRTGLPKDRAGLLVDEEFGADILRDASREGYLTAMPTESSGSDEFEFEYGAAFAQHIEEFSPTFAKALVRYNPEGDAALNQRQTARLKELSDYCHRTGRLFLFELLIPATATQMAGVAGDQARYDRELRPALLQAAITALQNSGVEPDVWKIEGLDRRDDCEGVVAVARRDGRAEVGCIVLGRGADEAKVVQWLETAATVPGFIGFAVGRTSFWHPLEDYLAKHISRDEAAARVAKNYNEWASIFEQAGGGKGGKTNK